MDEEPRVATHGRGDENGPHGRGAQGAPPVDPEVRVNPWTKKQGRGWRN